MPGQDTELIIKETARKIFQQRGFAATKTRDIAEAAGINLALLNYYFRSKKKLYDLIMMETIQSFFSGLLPIINDANTTLEEKIEAFVSNYIDMLGANPDMAGFIVTEVRSHPEDFTRKIGVLEKVGDSVFLQQFQQAMMEGRLAPVHPVHFILNFAGLVAFPFIARPLITTAIGLDEQTFDQLMQERKALIPTWIKMMFMQG